MMREYRASAGRGLMTANGFVLTVFYHGALTAYR
jgi:hypothetical protein